MNDSNSSTYPEIVKVRPKADAEYSDGIDGRNPQYYISYYCPNCQKYLKQKDIACDKCGTFFDWSKTAHIRMNPEIVWE